MSKMYKEFVKVNGLNKVLVTINHEQEQETTESKIVDSLHHIHVVDRSGSMYSELDQLIENVKTTVREMADEDYVSLVWFSGENQFKTLIKGARKDDSLYKLLDSIKSTVGLTCFSSPLKEVNEIIGDLSAICPNISVTLFTDGEPVVTNWSYSEEEKKIFEQIKEMKDNVLALNTIGYGYYYNQDLLRRMSQETMFGSAIHSSQIDEYVSIFHHNYEKVSDLLFEQVEIVAPMDAKVLYLNSTSTKMSNGYFKLNRLEKKKNQFFILADEEFKFEYNGELFDSNDIEAGKLHPSTLTNFYYAYAYELHYSGERQAALSIMSENIKDKYLIDTQLNAFTYDEVAKYRKDLKRAVTKPKYRFEDGVAPENYVPRDNALCVMDVLSILSEGTNFYVPSKNYSRIGQKVTDNFNLFKANKDEVRSPFNEFVFNKKHMNVSIAFTIRGTVSINAKQAASVGLPKEVDSQIFRTHTIIKDGNLNMETITAVLDQKTYDKLVALEASEKVSLVTLIGQEDEFYKVELSLSALPTVNRTYVTNSGDIDNIFNTSLKINGLEAQQKVLNHYIKEIKSTTADAVKEGKFADLTEEQIEILKQHGLDKYFTYGGIDNEKHEPVDHYESRTLEFAVKGTLHFHQLKMFLIKLLMVRN